MMIKEFDENVEKLLKDYDIDTSVDVVDFLHKEDFQIKIMRLSEKVTGMLLYDEEHIIPGTNSNKLIVVAEPCPIENARFIVAHEYAHFLLHRDNSKTMFAHRDYSKQRNTAKEIAADNFACCFLMPLNSIKKFLNNNGNLSYEEKIERLAKDFCVTTDIAKKRLKLLKETYDVEI